MKRFALLLLLSVISIASYAVPVKFVASLKSWNEVLLMAKKMNKKIFVDVYTTWCGPCKKMDTEVFTNAIVGDFFNRNFINVKVDAEKTWGIYFAKQNQVSAYPTYLFFDPSGKVVRTAIGFIPPNRFVEIAKLANKAPDVRIAEYETRYASGNYDANLLYNYIKVPGAIKANKSDLLEKYLLLIPREAWSTDSVQRLIYTIPTHFSREGMVYKALLYTYETRFPVKNGLLTSPWNIVQSKVYDGMEAAASKKDLQRFKELVDMNTAFETTTYAAKRQSSYLECIYYGRSGDAAGFDKAVRQFYSAALKELPADLYDADLKAFTTSLAYEPATSTRTPEELKKGFRSEAYRTFTAIKDIIFTYMASPKINSAENNALLSTMLNEGVQLYKNNKLHVSDFILKEGEKIQLYTRN